MRITSPSFQPRRLAQRALVGVVGAALALGLFACTEVDEPIVVDPAPTPPVSGTPVAGRADAILTALARTPFTNGELPKGFTAGKPERDGVVEEIDAQFHGQGQVQISLEGNGRKAAITYIAYASTLDTAGAFAAWSAEMLEKFGVPERGAVSTPTGFRAPVTCFTGEPRGEDGSPEGYEGLCLVNMGSVLAGVAVEAKADLLPLTHSAVAHLGRVQGAGA
jgi:hypothetical protein